jgi:hypothetical protein
MRCVRAGRRSVSLNARASPLLILISQIFEMFQNLFVHSLLPTRMLQMEDFLGGVSMIPLRGAAPPKPVARNEGGLLSALSSYLMTPYGANSESMVPEASESDVESTLSTIDCIAACRLDELYAQIMYVFFEWMTRPDKAETRPDSWTSMHWWQPSVH